MPEEYTELMTAMKALTQQAATGEIRLPMAEDGWNTRPDEDSWGEIRLEFEAGDLNGDGRKTRRAYEGSVDLYSRRRSGCGWKELIEETLENICGECWGLNWHGYERETSLFHWEWVFQVEE